MATGQFMPPSENLKQIQSVCQPTVPIVALISGVVQSELTSHVGRPPDTITVTFPIVDPHTSANDKAF
jgi:poly-beta-hydroxyalkanoate depolymerase